MAGKKIIETLVTELTADGTKFKKEMDDALKHAKTWGDRVTSIAKNVGVGLAAGGTALAASAAAVTKAAIDNADALYEQSQKLGITTESLSAYQYAASMSGLETDKFNGFVNKLNKTIIDAADGVGKGAEAFELLGVKVKDSQGNIRTNTDVLNDLAEAFSKLPDTAGKAALAQDIFGKSGAELIPFLNNGTEGLRDLTNEAERFNLIVDGSTAEAANKFNDELDKISKSADGIGNALAKRALPNLVKLAEFITDPSTQDGLTVIADGIIDIAGAAYKFIGVVTGLDLATQFLATLISTADKIKPSELAAKQKELNELIGRARIAYGEEYWKDQAFHRDSASKDIQRLRSEIKDLRAKPQKEFEAELDKYGYDKAFETYKEPKTAEDLIKGGIDKKNDPTKNWDIEQKREIAIMMEREKKAQEAADREVLMQREKFAQIHEEMLKADDNVVDLEKYRYQRQQDELQKEMDLLNEHGLLSSELELEFQMAKEEQEAAHQDRLKNIKEQAHQEDLERQQVQLQGYENLFGSLGDIFDEFGGRQSRARRLLLLAEKSAAIKSATISISEGIAKSASLGFPQNIPAIASTVAATAGLLGDIEAVGVAHGGLTNVPKEETYLLDKGERVVSPKQNRDLTDFLRSPGSGSIGKIEVINNIPGVQMQATAEQDGETMRLILTAVDSRLRQDLSNGRGVWAEAKQKYGWSTKGSI